HTRRSRQDCGDALCGDVGEQVCVDEGKIDPPFLFLLHVRDVDRSDHFIFPVSDDVQEIKSGRG
ncbi:MAG: hypothetical protein H6Q41_3278, partial [Deltaproteobacteria bacterium]|nr:hypothetical protein [Deltaproteobacteria bacterium]